MEVYIDILLLENMIINTLLLLITFKGFKYKYNKYYLYLSAFIGSIYTLVIFNNNRFLNSIFIKTLIVVIMILISIKEKRLKNIIKASLGFYLFSFMFAGVCFFCVTMENSYQVDKNFIIKENSIKWTIVALSLTLIVVIRIIDILKERAIINNFLYDICIINSKNTLYIKGFLDTGNELREPITNCPCIIIEEEYLKSLKLNKDNAFIIRYQTISDSGTLYAYKVDMCKIRNCSNEQWMEIDVMICSSSLKLSKDNEYQGLLSRGVI